MIFGRLVDVARQRSVLPVAIVRAIEILQKSDFTKMTPGRYEIEGDRLFYTVEDVVLRTIEESRPEAHVRYADIQIPLSVCERYGFSLPEPGLDVIDDQLETKDLAFYPQPANETFIDLCPGSYVVFLPGELHRSALVADEKVTLRKIVVKVHSSLLGLAD